MITSLLFSRQLQDFDRADVMDYWFAIFVYQAAFQNFRYPVIWQKEWATSRDRF